MPARPVTRISAKKSNKRLRGPGFGALLWLGVIAASPAVAAGRTQAAVDPQLAHGQYLFRAGGCYGCHTDAEARGRPLAGGRAMDTPFGRFYTPNITPDPETGIGRWREQDFVRALRDGVDPRGEHYYPAFPYVAYTRLTDDDLRDLWVYLRAQPAVRQLNRTHELAWYARSRSLLRLWKELYFRPGAYQPDRSRPALWNRGAYLVEAAAHCGECHTPRSWTGALDDDRRLAGTTDGPDDTVVPNITPDRGSGIGRWRTSDLVTYLQSGLRPDGDSAGGLMAEVIDNGLRHLRPDDLTAIAEYIRSVPPVNSPVRASDRRTAKKGEFD